MVTVKFFVFSNKNINTKQRYIFFVANDFILFFCLTVFILILPKFIFKRYVLYLSRVIHSFLIGDSIESHGTTNTNGNKFSTIDVDNDSAPGSCAVARKGAWWHNVCTWANLNGIYGNGTCLTLENCNFWYSLTNSFSGVKTSFMMVRRVSQQIENRMLIVFISAQTFLLRSFPIHP